MLISRKKIKNLKKVLALFLFFFVFNTINFSFVLAQNENIFNNDEIVKDDGQAPDFDLPPNTTAPDPNNSAPTNYQTLSPQGGNKDDTYKPLADIPGLENFDADGDCAIAKYLNVLIKIFIGISAVLAMVMIVLGGMEYMTSEVISSKEHGKERALNAIFGLLLALASYAILNTVNPELLNLCPKIPKANITISPEETLKNRSGGGKCEPLATGSGPCSPQSLASSFSGSGNAQPPFSAIASQASAICNLESKGNASTESSVDLCQDGNAFSFGLFQINASAHRNSLPASSQCANAFSIPQGHGQNQGNQIPGSYSWTCTVANQSAYNTCKNYLLNPANNVSYALSLYNSKGWQPWSTYSSCNSKF